MATIEDGPRLELAVLLCIQGVELCGNCAPANQTRDRRAAMRPSRMACAGERGRNELSRSSSPPATRRACLESGCENRNSSQRREAAGKSYRLDRYSGSHTSRTDSEYFIYTDSLRGKKWEAEEPDDAETLPRMRQEIVR